MPYALRRVKGKWRVMNKETGEVHSKGTSKEKAQSQTRLLYGLEEGSIKKPRSKK